MEIDISQAELRVLAHFTQEPALVSAFAAGDVDLHRRTASLALNIPEPHVTDGQRKIGKGLNFATIYGQTEHGLSKKLGCTLAEACDFLDGYFTGYPCVQTWIDQVIDYAYRNGGVRTLYGRPRTLPGLNHNADRREAERQAVNTIIQGTAADILKLATARLYQHLPAGCKLLLSVHDSFLLEVAEVSASAIACEIQRIVEQPPPNFSIPIRTDVKLGRTWLDCKTSTS